MHENGLERGKMRSAEVQGGGFNKGGSNKGTCRIYVRGGTQRGIFNQTTGVYFLIPGRMAGRLDTDEVTTIFRARTRQATQYVFPERHFVW